MDARFTDFEYRLARRSVPNLHFSAGARLNHGPTRRGDPRAGSVEREPTDVSSVAHQGGEFLEGAHVPDSPDLMVFRVNVGNPIAIGTQGRRFRGSPPLCKHVWNESTFEHDFSIGIVGFNPAAGDQQQSTFAIEGDRLGIAGDLAWTNRSHKRIARQVPNFDHAIAAAGDKAQTIGAERYTGHSGAMTPD